MPRDYGHQDRVWAKQVKALFIEAHGELSCVVCGTRENLEADHIKPWSKYPELRHDPDNGTIMCRTHNAQKQDKTAVRFSWKNERWYEK